MMLRKVLWTAVLFATTCVLGQDVQLGALRKTLVPMRGREPTAEGRGFPGLTTVKHQLRDWIESRLAALPQNGDSGPVAGRINQELKNARLFDEDSDEQNYTGTLGEIQMQPSVQGLIVKTRVG